MNGNKPGPWVADLDAQWGPCVYGDDAIIADYSMWDGRREEARAIARLIAAAPDLLEALTEIADAYSFYFRQDNPWGDKARAAIAKATGEAP